MMKRWFILLALLLLLTGCSENTTEPTETQPQQALALMSWELPGDGMTLVGAMEDGLLLHDGSQLMLLSVDQREILAAAVLEDLQNAQESDLQIGQKGISFFDRCTQTICFLDENLQKTSYLELQGQVQGSILLTPDWSKLYYCTPEGVHAVDLFTGIKRTIAYREEQWLGVTGVFMDTMLSCSIRQSDGTEGTLILSSDTGLTAWETGKVSHLSCHSQLYFGKMTTAGVEEWVFGWGGDQPRNFWPPVEAPILPLLENEMIVTAEDSQLSCYDLRQGRCVAKLNFQGASDISNLVYFDEGIFFTDGSVLYRWDLERTVVMDSPSYISFRYTEDDPDEAGLQEQQVNAMVLEKFYGVNIILAGDVTNAKPRGYEFAVEYVPEAYPQALEDLEQALSAFGRSFLKTAASWKGESELNIVLVRQILLGEESVPGIQYVLDDKVYIALAIDEDMEENFYHLMGHVVDTVVLRESLAFDDWEWLNPKDFAYDNSYEADPDRDYDQYLQPEDRWFIDDNSMRFQVEDRATIFACAIGPKNGEYFAGEHLQAKLQMLCKGIREAFELTGDDYPWEQYLNEETK